ncbi:MAG: alpha/beta fold hydrolase [Armatimonadetes bacterium]|nr:alpha/beta fold hydrolase [Armatimonadota bacterium]MDW8122636.1 alpha/beta fold hydrolase [Armatimonadota bacterium]
MAGVSPSNLSMGEYLLHLLNTVQPSMPMPTQDRQAWEDWRVAFSRKVLESLGPLPEPVADPQVVVIEKTDEGSFTKEKVLIQTEAVMSVPAYLLVPKGIKEGEKRAGILACHGHGNGKDDVCGITHGEWHRHWGISVHNYDYALQLVREGYVVLAPDWRGFGERRLGGSQSGKDHCDMLLIKCLLFGINPLGLNVWDGMRCLDFLQSRNEVDKEKLGCVGLSYGGTMTLFISAMDQRVKAAIISCYLNSLGSFAIRLGNFCGVQVPIGLLRYGDLAEVAALIAPRPLCIEAGLRDEVFPVDDTRRAIEVLRNVYRLHDCEDWLVYDEFDGGHQWHGTVSIPFLKRFLPPC